MQKKKYSSCLIIVLVTFLSFIGSAQETVIKGSVYDAETREALPFVNIKYKGGKPFTTSDMDGNFLLSTSTPPSDSIEVSYIGYLTYKQGVKPNSTQEVMVYLQTDAKMLGEAVILPGENPAHKILRKIIAKKDFNNKEKLKAYEYEVYNKVEFDMNNIPKSVKDKKVMKPIRFVFDYIDSTSVTEKPYLPLMLSESLSDYYSRKNPTFNKEIIKASRVSGIQDASIAQFMGEMYQKVNIYDNNILVFGKQFPSPISDYALSYYKFYLIDSLFIDNTRCYQLRFRPRRKQEFCFAGNLFIADTSFAVKRLEMSIPEDVNLNFVKALNVVQEYIPVSDSAKKDTAWMLSKDRLVVDFKYNENNAKQLGFYGRKTTSYKNIVVDKAREETFFSRRNNIIVKDSAIHNDESFWKNVRHDSLSKNEKLIYHIVDTIKSLPVYKTWYEWVYIATIGYKRFGLIELGPYYSLYSYNSIEGNRFRVGGRTTNQFSKRHQLNGYTAYGTLDKAFKVNAELKSFITKKPRQLISFNYKNDVEIPGQNANVFSKDNILATVFRRTPLNNMTAVQQYKTTYEIEPFSGFNMQFSCVNRVITPKGSQPYLSVTSIGDTHSVNNIIASEAKARIRFAFDEKYVEYTFTRTGTGTRYPVLTLLYTYGAKNIFRSNYEYHKLCLNINDRIRTMPLLGYTDYLVEAGKIFGTVPYPLMELHGGNETIIYDPHAFNMMNYYEFGSDEYLTLQAFHHFDGFFLNHIPLMRKLKWREVITAKAIIGDISAAGRTALILPGTLSALDRKPYYEVSAGIENIFKVFRVDALWRLSYIDKTYTQEYERRGAGKSIPKFAVMWSMHITF
jgi:hypothetical protein